MSYTENHKKFVIVLNRRQPLPRLLNAACHATAGLADLVAPAADMLAYPNAATGFVARISRYPVIVLEARNSSQLAILRSAADAQGIACNVFVDAMIGASAEGQQAATRDAPEAELEFLAVALFGDAAALDPLTRKFSLLRDPRPAQEAQDAHPA